MLPFRWAAALWALFTLFVMRVAAQMLVGLGVGGFLPPWEEWFSGALSYPWLLSSQLILVGLLGKVCLDLSRGTGVFASRRPAIGSLLQAFGTVYALVMVIRYVIRMTLYPPERWTGGSIPIFFHWVLAGFVLIVARYHSSRAPRRTPARRQRLLVAASWAVVSAGLVVWIAYQLAPLALAHVLESRTPEFAVRIERRVAMPMADGVTLRADVYRPVRAGRTPTILVRIPFSKTFMNTLFATVIGRFWAERGYTVVVQGTRGRYESDGRFYPLTAERLDGRDTLAWVARQPWFNGRIGTWGGSAFGHTQWALVDEDSASLHAMMVQIWSTDFHGVVYRGGALALQSVLFWAMRSGGPTDVWPDETTLARAAATRPVRDADNRAGEDVAFYNDWIDHEERDAYWEAIDGTDRSRRLGAPIHLMAGWYDPFLPGQLADFVRIRREGAPAVARQSRLVVGPWGHAETIQLPGTIAVRNYRLESLAPSLPWFDRHLRGLLPMDDPSAPVRLFVMGINQWRDEQEWPLTRARPVRLYLRSTGHARGLSADGRLVPEAPAAGEPADVFDYDPNDPVPTRGGAMLGPHAGIARQNDVEAREDVLVYSGPPLETDMEVTGGVSVRLHVSTTAPSTDFTAKLVDVHPDGAAYNVADGILRRRYVPASDPARAQPTAIDVDLGPTSIVFRRGHRIRVEISSSNFPRFDRNPNTGDAASTAVRSVPATQALHHDPAAASFVLLPVVP